jgi:type I restriction enzyme S subunit
LGLTSDWRHVGILDVAEIASGQVNPTRPPYCDMPLVAPNHIEEGTGRLLPVPTAAEQAAISGKYTFEAGDILYSKIRPYLRKVARPTFPGLCSADMYPLRSRGAIDPGFLFAILLGKEFTDFAVSVSMRTGIPKINREELAKFQFALPPLDEQRRIAAILSAVDEAIEATQAVIDQLRFVKKAMMSELLTRGLPGRHTRYKETEIGQLPEAWAIVAVDGVGDVQLGRQRSPKYQSGKHTRPYLRVVNVFDGRLDLRDVLGMDFDDDDFRRYQLAPGDVLLTEGDLVSAHNVGRSAVFQGEIEGCCFQNTLLRFRPRPGLLPVFAHYAFCHLREAGVLAKIANGTTVFHLGAERLRRLVRLPIPELDEQAQIAAILQAVDDRIDAEVRSRAAVSEMKAALMSALLTGDLRVTPNEDAA